MTQGYFHFSKRLPLRKIGRCRVRNAPDLSKSEAIGYKSQSAKAKRRREIGYKKRAQSVGG